MLSKLLKYDFRAFSHQLFPLQLGVLAGSILAIIFCRLTMVMTNSGSGSFVFSIFGIFSGLMTGLLFTVICGSTLVTLILICIRVQKNLFGDEGYLTFTLPTTTNQLLWSKIITGTVWMLINGLVVALALFIFGLFGTTQHSLVNSSVLQEVGRMFSILWEAMVALFTYDEISGAWFMVILGIVNMLIYVLMEVLTVYFAVIAGGVAAKKYKLLVSTGIYLAAQFALKLVLFAAFAIAGTLLESSGPSPIMWSLLIGGILVQGAVSTGLFVWSHYLLKNKLNLQ